MSDSDQDLLDRFVASRDEAVFTALVERHQALVLGSCRRVLADAHDAEDAAQAVFLVLAKRAGSIDASRSLAPWLHRVATNLALDAWRARQSRERHQREAAAMSRSTTAHDLREELDAALCRLPESERSAIVLFHLEGRSLDEIASTLRRPVATVGSWLQRGRERLRGLLTRRGVALSGAALLSGLGSLSAGEIPAGFSAATAKAALAFSATGAAATPAATLALKGCHAMKLAALIKTAAIAAAIVVAVGTAGLVVAAEPGAKPAAGGGKANAGVALGAPDFMPTPERPLGWRGDGTDLFTGATPPLTWSRRITGSAVSNARYQPGKPKGDAEPKNAQPLELGIIKDWLVIGPFPIEDPTKDISKPCLPDEATVQPDADDKVGTLSWKPLHVTLDAQSSHNTNGGICNEYNVDFTFVFGHQKNQIAYAHTYVWSPTGGSIQFAIHRPERTDASWKIWLNGQVTEPYVPKATLLKGWNRLLVKVCCADSVIPGNPHNEMVSKWRFSAYMTPLLPVAYETKSIAWMTKMPGMSTSPPLAIGDKLYTTASSSTLMCLDKKDGRILWLTTATPCDAASDVDKAAPGYQDKVVPLAAELKKADAALMAELNASNALTGLAPDKQAKVDAAIRQHAMTAQKVHEALKAIDAKKYPLLSANEVSGTNGTPCTDGQRIYIAVGGGLFGTAAYVMAAYTLEGQPVWSYHEALGCGEHGYHGSPFLVDGKLIFGAKGTLLALDAATGKQVWRTRYAKEGEPGFYEAAGRFTTSCLPTRIGGTAVLVTAPGRLIRAADGQMLSQADEIYFRSISIPVIANGVVYCEGDPNGGRFSSFLAVQLPATAEGAARNAWQLAEKDYRIEASSRSSLASGIAANGVFFSVDTMGGLSAIDLAGQKLLYRRRLDMYQRADRGTYGFTACPVVGGKNLYLFDNTGCGMIIEAGPQYKEVGRNIIDNLVPSLWWDYKQELFYGSPCFDGKAIYLKGSEYLYCIREP